LVKNNNPERNFNLKIISSTTRNFFDNHNNNPNLKGLSSSKLRNLQNTPNKIKFLNLNGKNNTNYNNGFLTHSNNVLNNLKKKDTDKLTLNINITSTTGQTKNLDQSIFTNENILLTNDSKSLNNQGSYLFRTINNHDQANILKENDYMINNSNFDNITESINNNKVESSEKSIEKRGLIKDQICISNEMNDTKNESIKNNKDEILSVNKNEFNIYKDLNDEKYKFLETVCEKLSKNSSRVIENTIEYCEKYLNYSTKEIKELMSK